MMTMMITSTAIKIAHIYRNHTHTHTRVKKTPKRTKWFWVARLRIPRHGHLLLGTFTLQFFHQYFLFSLAALVSNCEAPAWRASARSSSSDSFWSRSRTLSTFTRMMSTTWGTRDKALHVLQPEQKTKLVKTQVRPDIFKNFVFFFFKKRHLSHAQINTTITHGSLSSGIWNGAVQSFTWSTINPQVVR